MASNIPGRRISYGETFYTDWAPRGGDCALLRAQALFKETTNGKIQISLETRSAEASSATAMTTVYPSGSPNLLEFTAVGVKTAIYTATADATTNPPIRGCKEQVRIKIAFVDGAKGDHYVIRLFAPVFFDNSKP
jgi:hypothetical protein